MGLPVKSEQLWDLLTIANLQAGIANHSADITNLEEEISTNNAGIGSINENITNLQEEIATYSAGIGSINKDIANLKSCQARWNIDCDEGVWQQNARDYAGHKCSNWYGWTSIASNPNASIGSISTTLNGTVIASVPKNTPSVTVEFDFEIGSILKIAEHGGQIIQFNSLNIIQCNGENDDGKVLSSDVIHSADIAMNMAGIAENDAQIALITNLKSCQTSWTIDCAGGVWKQTSRDYVTGYGQVCSNWWCSTGGPPIGSISTTFNGIGRAKLDFGNCWMHGTVKATLNGTVIASAPQNTPSVTVEFDFHVGSILKIAEHGSSIMQSNSLDVLQCNEEIGNF